MEGWLHCVNSRGQKGLLPSSFVRILGPGESYPPPASQRNRPPSVDYFSQVPADILCCEQRAEYVPELQKSQASAVFVAADSMGAGPDKFAAMLAAFWIVQAMLASSGSWWCPGCFAGQL